MRKNLLEFYKNHFERQMNSWTIQENRMKIFYRLSEFLFANDQRSDDLIFEFITKRFFSRKWLFLKEMTVFIFQIWNCVMSAVEWNKKEDLLQEQALRHLKQYTTLFAAFATNYKSELVLLNKVQEYCYDNMNFIKTFNKIVLLFYKSKFTT